MAWSGPPPKWLGERGCLVPGRTTEASLEFAGDRRVSYRASILQRSIKSNNHGRRNAQNRIRGIHFCYRWFYTGLLRRE